MRILPEWLLSAAAALLLLVSTGCQTPLKSTETAEVRPPKSLLGEAFDSNAAREKSRSRRLASENSAAGSPTESLTGSSRTDSAIAQAGFRNESPERQSQSSQQSRSAPQPQTPEAIAQHIRLGSEAMSRRAWADATIHYEAILAADTRNPLAHQMLGRIGDQTQKFESAEYHYLRALSSRPQDPNLLSDLGYSFLQQGRLSEAKQYLLKSLAIDADHQMAKANLAAVEAYSGNIDAARALLKQVSSEQQADQTLHELLSRPAPSVQRDQQLLSQGTEGLAIKEQMRIARDTARSERDRRAALEELEMQKRVRQAMALDGPLSRMGRGITDEELSEMIQQIEEEGQQTGTPASRSPEQPQQYAAGTLRPGPSQNGAASQFDGHPQFGAPLQQSYAPQQPNGYGAPPQNQYPPPRDGSSWATPNEWSSQNIPYSQNGPDANWGQQNPQYNGQGYGAPGPQQARPQQWQPPTHNLQQWNGEPQMYDSLQNGNPAWSQQQQQNWQSPPAQNPAAPGSPPLLNNLQQQNELLLQQMQQQFSNQQYGPTGSFGAAGTSAPQPIGDQSPTGMPQQFGSNGNPANSNPYQSFPNGQQQYAPPNQFQAAPAASQPATSDDRRNDFNGNSSQYAPTGGSGVWNPQAARSAYGQPAGAIQQLGYQSSDQPARTGATGPAGQNSMRQALRLGMAAGPGSLIQMDGRPPAGTPPRSQPETARPGHQPAQHRATSGANNTQQFFPENAQSQPGVPSSAVWNSGGNGSQQNQSPNQNLWQSGPMPNAGQNTGPSRNESGMQWQSLPSAQQQPQSSTWNHQHQQPVGPMQSQNWSTPQSPGSNWQSNSFGASPTASDAFAPRFMLHPDPTQDDTAAATVRAGFDLQGGPPNMTTAAPANPSGNRIPWSVR